MDIGPHRLTIGLPIAVALLALVPPAGAECPGVTVDRHTVGGRPVVVVRPTSGGPFPVVYALAGLGEMVRGPSASAAGWIEKYGLVEAFCAVSGGALTTDHFQGLVDGPLLDAYQQRMAAGFGGLVVVSPGIPRRPGRAFRKHLFEELIPWAERELPIKAGRAYRGIDGISLGGRHALRFASERPELFRTVGTEQAAVKGLIAVMRRAVRLRAEPMKALVFNLLSSHKDGFRRQIARFATGMRGLGLTIRHAETPGRHDKRFARGPGVIDMLLFHDAVFRGLGADKHPRAGGGAKN